MKSLTQEQINETVEYFDSFINKVVSEQIEGIQPMDLIMHYNILRNIMSQYNVGPDLKK